MLWLDADVIVKKDVRLLFDEYLTDDKEQPGDAAAAPRVNAVPVRSHDEESEDIIAVVVKKRMFKASILRRLVNGILRCRAPTPPPR